MCFAQEFISSRTKEQQLDNQAIKQMGFLDWAFWNKKEEDFEQIRVVQPQKGQVLITFLPSGVQVNAKPGYQYIPARSCPSFHETLPCAYYAPTRLVSVCTGERIGDAH